MAGAYVKLSAKVIDKAVTEVGKQQGFNNVPEESSPFKQMLDSMNSGHEFAESLGMTNQTIDLPSHTVNAISAEGINVDMNALKVGLNEPSGINKVVDLLSEVNDNQMQMQNLVNEILYSGKRFSNQELLAIQAHVYHYAQVTELVVKTADHGISSLKTVMNTNIQ